MKLSLRFLSRSASVASRHSGAATPKTPRTPKSPMVSGSDLGLTPSSRNMAITPRPSLMSGASPFDMMSPPDFDSEPVTPRLQAAAAALSQQAPIPARTPVTPKTPKTPMDRSFPVLLGRCAIPPAAGDMTSPSCTSSSPQPSGGSQKRRVHFDDPAFLHVQAHEAFLSRERRRKERHAPFRV